MYKVLAQYQLSEGTSLQMEVMICITSLKVFFSFQAKTLPLYSTEEQELECELLCDKDDCGAFYVEVDTLNV